MSIIAYRLDRSRKLKDHGRPGAGKQTVVAPKAVSEPGARSASAPTSEPRRATGELPENGFFVVQDQVQSQDVPEDPEHLESGFVPEEPFQPSQSSWGVERRSSVSSVDQEFGNNPGAPRVTQQSSAQGVPGEDVGASACITDIFRSGRKKPQYEIGMNVYPGVTTIHTEGKIVPGRSVNPGTKQKITSFSAKSRNNLLKHFGMMEVAPEIWQTFTFADDVMKGKGIEDRTEYSGYCMNRFEKYLSKHHPEIGMTWRREWEKRKRGCLEGQYCPHYHVMYYKPNTNPEEYMTLVILFALEWVRITGTKDPSALKVALHRKSYALLDSRTTAMKYVSKYMSKGCTVSEEGESIGRSWGIIGNIPMAKPEEIRLTDVEAVIMLRFLRRYAKHKKSLVRNLKSDWLSTFVLISKGTMDRMLYYIEDTITEQGRTSYGAGTTAP